MKAEQNLWIQKKKKIIMIIAAAMVVIFVVSFVSFFKTDEVNVPEEKKPYESMYNASRYFFRVFYPDDWDVNAEQYGFFLDEEGLVLELFPLKKISATSGATGSATATPSPTPTASAGSTASATVDPRAGMERNTDLTIKFYYKKYDDIKDKIVSSKDDVATDAENTDVIQTTPTPSVTGSLHATATATGTASKRKAPVELIDLAEYLFDEFKEKNKDSEYKYSFTAPKTYKGDNADYCVLPYTYVKDDIKMSGEMYVASRSMCYYIIYVDGTSSAFTKYNTVVENMLYNLKLSVFDD